MPRWRSPAQIGGLSNFHPWAHGQNPHERVAEVGGFAMPAFEQIAAFDEQSFGDWEGETWDELYENGRSHTFWLAPAAQRPPNGRALRM